jgi:hypothetical protein
VTYPRCTFCGSETADHYFKDRNGMICEACVRLAGAAHSVPVGTSCSLCGRRIGSRAGMLWRRTVVAVLAGGAATLCSECLALAREATTEQAVAGTPPN